MGTEQQRDCVNNAQEVYLNSNGWEIKPLLLTANKKKNFCYEEQIKNKRTLTQNQSHK